MKYKLVYIEWEDAITNNLKWFDEEQAKDWAENTTMLIYECGWILKETKRFIVIANRYSKTSISNGESSLLDVGGLHKIPKTWIRKRVVLKV